MTVATSGAAVSGPRRENRAVPNGPLPQPSERVLEPVAVTDDGDRHPGAREPEQRPGGRGRLPAGIGLRVHGDERAETPDRASRDERVLDDLGPRAHDDELGHGAERAARSHQLAEGRPLGGLDRCQGVECCVPVPSKALHAVDAWPGRRDDEQRPAGAARMCAHETGGDAHRIVEARAPHGACDGQGVDVEDDRDAVARRILELPHHQLAPARGRRPVHRAQRLPLDVLPDAVRLEPARPAHVCPASAFAPGAALGEQRSYLRHAWPDEHGRAWGNLPLDRHDAERVTGEEPPRTEPVPPAWNVVDDQLRPAAALDRDRDLPERADGLP